MKQILFLFIMLLFLSPIYGQTGKSVLSTAQKDTVKRIITDSLGRFWDSTEVQTKLNLKLTASDTLSLSNRINTKLTATDTISLSNRVNLKLNSADTTSLSNRINLKAPIASPTFTGTVTIPTPFTLGAVSVLSTGTELNFVDGVTSGIQAQIDGKQSTLTNSAGLLGALNDETGTGLAVFNASPTFIGVVTAPSFTGALNASDGDPDSVLFIDATGNVGIGTTSPVYTLDVNGNLRASLSLSAGINVETISDAKTLTPGTDKMTQYLNPDATTRIITLATSTAFAGDRFIIRHNGAHDRTSNLTIQQGATALDYIFAQATKEYVFNGTDWVAGDGVTGISGDKNISIGYSAYGYGYGAAIGYQAQGYSSGAAIGYSAYGYSSGAAVGYQALGYSSGAAVGRNAKGMRYGAALGYQAGYSIDIGADRYNIVIGSKAGYNLTTGLRNIVIGVNTDLPAVNSSNMLSIGNLIYATGLSAFTSPTSTISTGNVGIGLTAPTSKLHLAAGTATAETAPLGFTSGTLLTTPVAGKVEFLTDAYYGTITTDAARKTFAFLESPVFTGTVTIPTPFTLGAVSITATGTELNYVAGVTSAIQTQLGLRVAKANSSLDSLLTFTSDGTDLPGTNVMIGRIGGEVRVQDSAGNETVISPHPKEFDGRWMYLSEKDGEYTAVDWENFIRAVEKITGEKFIYKGSIEKIKKEIKQ